MENDDVAEFGSSYRPIDNVPNLCFTSSLNSPGSFFDATSCWYASMGILLPPTTSAT